MSSAKAGAKAGAAAASPPADTTPPQTAVLLVQVEALGADDAIRTELKKKGFTIAQQALVYFTPEDARHFVAVVSNPESAIHAKPTTPRADNDTDRSPPGSSSGRLAEPTDATSPRDKTVATPREKKQQLPPDEDAIRGLAGGPVLMLVVEKPQAVADLQELVGPATPEAWAAVPTCLRARFGEETVRIGARCTAQEATAAAEVAFLLAHTQPPSATHHHHQQQRSADDHDAKSAAVDLDQLLAFLFPPHVLHPNSTGRLIVFGLYGPLDGRAQLRAGEKGLHVVTDRELDAMSSRMEREDILNVYDMCSLSQEEEEDVLRTVDGGLKAFPRYTKRDVEKMFANLPRGTDGTLSFHDMQAAIMKERCRRVLCMKERVHPALAAPVQNKFRQTMTRIMKTKDEVAPVTMFLKDLGFTGAENATLVARLLSNHSFQICQMDDGNSPELTQNVRLLRDHIHKPGDPRAPWNPNTISRK